MQSYSPNPAADARAAGLIRALLYACLLAPLLSACATTPPSEAHSIAGETAEPTRLTTNRK